MGKDKFRRFQENLTFTNMVQPSFEEAFHTEHALKGRWHEDFFGNRNPIVLELGCGRGEYTVALAAANPDKNFIGVDIKGARMWRGAKTATESGLRNAGFLRTRIEFIDSFFAAQEVDEIWITFPDPQPKKQRRGKRLTSPLLLALYARFVRPSAPVHLKTDSLLMHDYTKAVATANGLTIEACDSDIYKSGNITPELPGTASTDALPHRHVVSTASGNVLPADAENPTGAVSPDITSIKTAYESRFLGEGRPITYLRFTLGERLHFCEPNFEEESYYPGEVRE